MNKLNTLFLLAFLLLTFQRSDAQSCCARPVGMQAMALTASFKAAHEPPAPLAYEAKKGAMMSFPVTGGAEGHAFYVPGTSNKVLIIFHEWWGLNDYIKREAEEWQNRLGEEVSVYAIDLYDGQVATAPDEASKMMSALTPERGKAIIAGLLKVIGGGKRIATLGWCMGGSWSFTGAVLAGPSAVGCVMYYGFPEKDMARIKPLKCDVLYIRGSKDDFIKQEDVAQFEKKVQSTGHNITMYSYEAVHAFANPSNPKYDKKSAADAQGKALAFLKQKL